MLKKYTKIPNVQVIEPDFNILPFCQNKEKIIKLFNHGVEKTKKILGKISY